MSSLFISCRLEKCYIDNTSDMDIRKCMTQNDPNNPDRFNPCQHLHVQSAEDYRKGDVWRKFGDMVDKSKTKKDKLY